MERDRGSRIIAIVAICIAVVGVSIAYASLSQTLNIVGNATVQGNGWVVKFDTAKTPIVQTTGTAVATADNVTLNATDVTVDGIKLVAPGDSVSIIFDIKNAGDIDAELDSITNKTPTFTGSGEDKTTDETLVENNWEYSINYYDSLNSSIGAVPTRADKLAAGETATVILKITFKNTASSVPNTDVKVDGFGSTLVYIQD